MKPNSNTSSNIDPINTQCYDETSTHSSIAEIDPLEEEDQAVFDNDPRVPSTSRNAARAGEVWLKRKLAAKRKLECQQIVLAGKRSALERSIASCAKDLTNILTQSLEMHKEDRHGDQFGHKAFLLSLVPVLNSMPFHTAMQLRGQISDIFSDYFRQYENNSATFDGPAMTPTTTVSNDSDTKEFLNV